MYPFKPLDFDHQTPPEMQARCDQFLKLMKTRRSVRDYSDQPVPIEIIEQCIKTAATAPSGANRQPWHFVAVKDQEIKHQIRVAAEKEEQAFYEHRAPESWLKALAPLATDDKKPFLETAPWLIAVFLEKYAIDDNGDKHKHYYTPESVGLATGFLIAAIHNAGLVCLTHTPSPMKFLNKILGRPGNERPYLLLVVGYPSADATVPDIDKKHTSEIMSVK